MENNQDAPEVLETPVEPVEEQTEEPQPEPEAPQISAKELEALRAKAAQADELEVKNKKLFTRAKEAETVVKKQSSKEDGLSNKDVIFLAKADIHEDDVQEVIDWSKFKKISVSDAYKQLKDTLDVRAEQRKTAAATQVKGGARGTSKVSGEDLLARAERTGDVPESDDGMAELFKARLARRIPKKN